MDGLLIFLGLLGYAIFLIGTMVAVRYWNNRHSDNNTNTNDSGPVEQTKH